MELILEGYPEHLRMGRVRLREGKETEEEDKQKSVKMERKTAGSTKSLDGPTVARSYHPPQSLFPETVEELHKKPSHTYKSTQ